jgi:hypothetical protein
VNIDLCKCGLGDREKSKGGECRAHIEWNEKKRNKIMRKRKENQNDRTGVYDVTYNGPSLSGTKYETRSAHGAVKAKYNLC